MLLLDVSSGSLSCIASFVPCGPQIILHELGIDLHRDFQELWLARSALDQRIVIWSRALDRDWLEVELTYTSKVDGVSRTVPRWVLVTHMFNHETHHRGQVTTLLSQIGLDVGTTDLPFMPQFQASGVPPAASDGVLPLRPQNPETP